MGSSPEQVAGDVIPQLKFIRDALRNGAGEQMQSFFPEGFFFSHALYGLTWIEIGKQLPPDAPMRAHALQEARWAVTKIDSSEGHGPFNAALTPRWGIFYAGWSACLRGGVLMLQPSDYRNGTELSEFQSLCGSIAEAFTQSSTPYLAAYPGQSWPCDSVVAIAALRLHDQLLPPGFSPLVQRWLAQVRKRLDPATGLMPHRADVVTGEPIEIARGSSQSIIQRFLPEIDSEFADQQYALFRQSFLARPVGVTGIREYPIGVDGSGDIDSGPLIFGLSMSATAVTIGAAQVHGDAELARPLIQLSEAFGVPIEVGESKRYLLGCLPVADAFLAWAKASSRGGNPSAATYSAVVGWWWRLPLHVLSLVLIAVLWLPVYLNRLLRLIRHYQARRCDKNEEVNTPNLAL